MGKRPIAERDRRLALLCDARALRQAIEHAALEVDIPAAVNALHKSGRTDGAGARARVEANEHKAGDVAQRVAVRRIAALHFAMAIGGPNDPSRFVALEPFLPRLGFCRQRHGYELAAIAFTPAMRDRGAQVLE